jgi:hypothetical protein
MEINRELLTGNINLTLDVYGTPEECGFRSFRETVRVGDPY